MSTPFSYAAVGCNIRLNVCRAFGMCKSGQTQRRKGAEGNRKYSKQGHGKERRKRSPSRNAHGRRYGHGYGFGCWVRVSEFGVLRDNGLLVYTSRLTGASSTPATHEQRRRVFGERGVCNDAARAIGGLPRGLSSAAGRRSPSIAR